VPRASCKHEEWPRAVTATVRSRTFLFQLMCTDMNTRMCITVIVCVCNWLSHLGEQHRLRVFEIEQGAEGGIRAREGGCERNVVICATAKQTKCGGRSV
jgi:hypothetical protein